jgi:hypothetical protein
MSNNQINDPITDKEIAFAHLVLTGTMTDRRAAKAVGLNPDIAASTKAKPCVHAYMMEQRATNQERLVQQETEEARRDNLGRGRVLARLWEIANLGPEMTRNSMSAQIKALSMIVAIEGLIASQTNNRRAGSAQSKPAPPLVDLQIDAAAWLDEQQGKTTGPGASGEPSQPHVPGSASAPDTRVASTTSKKPDTWRLRL